MTAIPQPRRYFPERLAREPASYRVARWATIAILAVHVPLAMASGVRAIVQVYSVRIAPPALPLRAGSRVDASTVISGRATVKLQLELRQGERTRLLGEVDVPGNHDPAFDPRPGHGALAVVLTPAMLEGFDAGPAVLRAAGHGRSQWLRIPPPKVVELPVVLAPGAPPPRGDGP